MMKHLAHVAFGLSLVTGCLHRGDGVDTDSAESAVESAETAESEGNVMMAAVDGADVAVGLAPATPDQIAARVAANLAGRWNPRACATATQTGATVSVTLNDCTGPRGLVHVSGHLTLVVSVSASGVISVHGTSDDLEANGASLDLDANAVYSTSGTSHSIAVTTQSSGVGPRGLEVQHDGDYTITWDTATQCRSIAGDWSTEIGSATRSTTASLSRCTDGCPSGSVVRHTRTGQTITVTFDGQGTAAWSSTSGRSGSVTLACAR